MNASGEDPLSRVVNAAISQVPTPIIAQPKHDLPVQPSLVQPAKRQRRTQLKKVMLWSTPNSILPLLLYSLERRSDTKALLHPFELHLMKEGFGRLVRYAQSLPPPRQTVAEMVESLTDTSADLLICGQELDMPTARIPELLDALTDWQHIIIVSPPSQLFPRLILDPTPNLQASGYPQLADVIMRLQLQTGRPCTVFDANAFLANAPKALAELCSAIGVDFQNEQLSWSSGLHASDPSWTSFVVNPYASSTGFTMPPFQRLYPPPQFWGYYEQLETCHRQLLPREKKESPRRELEEEKAEEVTKMELKESIAQEPPAHLLSKPRGSFTPLGPGMLALPPISPREQARAPTTIPSLRELLW
jgi:hypothetical protein